jgi:hypothetical protein
MIFAREDSLTRGVVLTNESEAPPVVGVSRKIAPILPTGGWFAPDCHAPGDTYWQALSDSLLRRKQASL